MKRTLKSIVLLCIPFVLGPSLAWLLWLANKPHNPSDILMPVVSETLRQEQVDKETRERKRLAAEADAAQERAQQEQEAVRAAQLRRQLAQRRLEERALGLEYRRSVLAAQQDLWREYEDRSYRDKVLQEMRNSNQIAEQMRNDLESERFRARYIDPYPYYRW